MDTPPEGNADTLAGALSCLNVKAKLPGSTPKRSHGKRKQGVEALFVEHEAHPGPRSPVSRRSDGADPVKQRFPPWSAQEEQALVSFVLLYTEGTRWCSRASKSDRFWENAGAYIQSQVHSKYCQTGTLSPNVYLWLLFLLSQGRLVDSEF